jgi:hypothetical protein
MVTGASAGPRTSAGSMVTFRDSAAQAAPQTSVTHRDASHSGL